MKTLYVCGPTLYSKIHIGNARSLVFFDVLAEFYRRTTGVKYARNITDIDDKIFSLCGNEDPATWVDNNTLPQFRKDCDFLGVKNPDIEPRASDYINQIIKDNERLRLMNVAKEDGFSTLLDTTKVSSYGEVSGRTSNSEFAIWKATRQTNKICQDNHPGWHSECASMIGAIFGPDGVDIHGGGVDLTFPHHENENAIHRCLTGNPIAKEWVRVGMINVDGVKMAKSVGNIVTIDALSKDWDGMTIRTSILMSKHSKPFDFTHSRLKEAEKTTSKNPLRAWPTDAEWTPKMMDQFAKSYNTRI